MNPAAAMTALLTMAYISTHTYMNINPRRYRRKPMTTEPTTHDIVTELCNTRLLCLGCVQERYKAEQNRVPEDQLPAVNIAQVIVNGMGQCLGHVQFVDRPLIPGERPSGIFLPGQVG